MPRARTLLGLALVCRQLAAQPARPAALLEVMLDAYPTPGNRSCPWERLTQVCTEDGSGPIYDNMTLCPTAPITPTAGWVCKEQDSLPHNGFDPELNDPVPITRQEILQRAVVWINRGLRYSQRRYHKETDPSSNTEMAYRTDCSGYVSMSWKAGVAPSTSLYCCRADSKLFARLPCNELLPGDALVTSATGHILLFRSWVSQTAGSFASWEEMGTAKGAAAYQRKFNKDMTLPYGANDTHILNKDTTRSFLCLRRKGIVVAQAQVLAVDVGLV